jgi:DNA replication protein DnaC
MSKIDETLKKIAAGTTKVNSPTSSNTKRGRQRRLGTAKAQPVLPDEFHDLPGDPNCPNCSGVGYIREDLPVGHPEFGRLQICTCRQAQVSQQVHSRLFALSNLDELRRLTFESFKPRGHIGLPVFQADSSERAYHHAWQYAHSLDGWLLLQGGYGCGKTHLAAAIANFAVDLGVPTLFITVPDMLDALRFAYGETESSFEERFEEIRRIELLILDDFGTQNATSWAQEKLFQIINFRYINRLPLVVTTNLGTAEIEERVRSRLQDPELVTRVPILAPDYRNPAQESSHPQISSLGQLSKRTFATFESRQNEGLDQEDLDKVEKAFLTAREYAENPRGWLVILGPDGCGKTHLAAAIGNFRSELGIAPVLVSAPDLLDHLRSTFSPTSSTTLDQKFEMVRNAPLLILDDLGTQSSSPWAREKLYQLFNHRYNNELPTVITTADPLDDIDPRLRSRMLDRRFCRIVSLSVPVYTGGVVRARKTTRKGK